MGRALAIAITGGAAIGFGLWLIAASILRTW